MLIKDIINEVGGVGVVAGNAKMAKDPRYSNSMTVDIKPGETQRQAAKFGNKTDKLGMPPKLKTNGKISEAAMSVGIQAQNPISAGARGLVASRWKFEKTSNESIPKNNIAAVDSLQHKLENISKIDYNSIDDVMQHIAYTFYITPEQLHKLFVKKLGKTPDDYAKQYYKKNKDQPLKI